MRRSSALLFLALSLPLQAFAADPGPPPPTPPPASDFPPPPPPPPPSVEPDSSCVPACRQGYACQNGACVPVNGPDAPVADEPQHTGEPGANPLINSRGERAPRGEHWESKRKIGLIITGGSLFVVGYALAAFVGVISYQQPGASTRLLHFIPLAGPAISELLLISSGSSTLFGDLLFMVADTAVQITGLILALVGIPRREVLVDDPPGYQRPAEPNRPSNEPGQPPARDSNLPPIQWSFAPIGPGGSLGFSIAIRN